MRDVVPAAVGAFVPSQLPPPFPGGAFDFGLYFTFGPIGVLVQAHLDLALVPDPERVHVLAVEIGTFTSWPSIAVGILNIQVHSSTLARRLPPYSVIKQRIGYTRRKGFLSGISAGRRTFFDG